MSKFDELTRMQLQKRFKSPVGVRENEETIYTNIAHEPLMLDNVRQIKVLQLYDAIRYNIDHKDPAPPERKSVYLYVIDKREQFLYSSDGKLYYKGAFYTQQELQDLFGITQTPSVVYFAKDGVIRCWYNDYLKMYWDVDTSQWYVDAPIYNEDTPVDIDDINEVGSRGLFLFSSPSGDPMPFGSLISANTLTPICLKYSLSGSMSCTKMTTKKLTGTWKLLTATAKSSSFDQCIVFVVKVSSSPFYQSDNENTSNNTNSNNQIEITEYNL